MTQFRLLTIDELKNYHTQKTTDFAFLLGAWQTEKSAEQYKKSPFLQDEFVDSPRFSATLNNQEEVAAFGENGQGWNQQKQKDFSYPLVLEKNFVHQDDILVLNKKGRLLDEDDNSSSFLFGAYPQTVVGEAEARRLTQLYFSRKLIKTKNFYTYLEDDSKGTSDSQRPQKIFEYEFNGSRYVCIVASKGHFLKKHFRLSDGQEIEPEKMYWVKVEPLKWNVIGKRVSFKEKKLNEKAFSSVAPISGMSWDKIPTFLTRYFSKEILQSNHFCLEQEKLHLKKIVSFKRLKGIRIPD